MRKAATRTINTITPPAVGACESPECRIRGAKANLILRGEPMHSGTIFDANIMLSKGVIMGEVKVTGLVEKYTDEFLEESKVKEKPVKYKAGIDITKDEFENLRSQFVTLNKGFGSHRKYLPYVFTEQMREGAKLGEEIKMNLNKIEFEV